METMTENNNMSAYSAFEQIKASATETIDKSKTQLFSEDALIGEYVRQGDVYIRYLGDTVDTFRFELDKKPVAQVVEGETQGSRHILDSLEGVTVYKPIEGVRENDDIVGPVLVLEHTRTLTHPEHGDWELPGDFRVYSITYAREFGEEIKRQLD